MRNRLNSLLWGKTLLKLPMAKLGAEFDHLFTEFMNSTTADPEYKAIVASRQAAYERNVQKLKLPLK